jgi:probable F420-dependent oxidoreductase
VKIRIGVGLGTRTGAGEPEVFRSLVGGLEDLGFDSLWLSERVNSPAPDSLIGLAVAAGATRRLKLGTSVLVLPGRNPALLAKELATLDRLSNGRLLPAVGLGAIDPREQQAFGVRREERAGLFDEALPLLRRLWSEDRVTHEGAHYRLDGVDVRPKPVQRPPDVWLGGRAPSELRRVGRLGDGWLPSFCTPDEVREGLKVVTAEADRHGRAIDPGHIGALVLYHDGPVPDEVAEQLSRRFRGAHGAAGATGGDKGIDPRAVVPAGLGPLREQLERFVEAGATKFVVVPLIEPGSAAGWGDELGRLADAVLPLQT